MMGMNGVLETLTIISTAVLLSISFFILVLIRKIEGPSLKTFGYIIVVFLWIAAALVFSRGIYTLVTGTKCMMPMMQGMDYSVMPRMQQRMMQKDMGSSIREKMRQRMNCQQQPAQQDPQSPAEN